MKILQSGDLHLGKLFSDFSLIDDQKYVLDQLIEELNLAKSKNEPYDVLLLCGDIYDRAIPPVEACQLFSSFLTKLNKNQPELPILIISGNHDSANRLSFASELLKSQNIFIVTSPNQIEKPICIKNTEFFLIPFLNAGSISMPCPPCPPAQIEQIEQIEQNEASEKCEAKNTDAITSQSEMLKVAVEIIKNAKDNSKCSVVMAHLFAAGSVTSDSERTIWGNAEQVDSHLFDDFTYTALGHLHRYQKAGKAFYSGSPLVYSFDECKNEKCFLKIEFDDTISTKATPQVTPIFIKPLRKAVRLAGNFNDFFIGTKYDEFCDCYCEISIDNEEIVENPVMLLKNKFKYLLSFKQDKAFANVVSEQIENRKLGEKESIFEQFKMFLAEVSENIDENEIELFKTCQEKIENQNIEGYL